MTLRVRRLDAQARLPTRAYGGDAGLDLHAADGAWLEPGRRTTIPTGIAIELPPGHAGLVLPRSGLAANHGIALVNAPGLIDSGYRGEIKVVLLNTDQRCGYRVEPGERIAQLLVIRHETPTIEEVDELAVSERGSEGFGSSGN